MKTYIVANWKMNPGTLAEAERLFRAEAVAPHGKEVEVVVCPPFVYLEELGRVKNAAPVALHAKLGGQDDFADEEGKGTGPYTGEVSPTMLKRLGAEYVILGHSERRKAFNENDAVINKKVHATLKAGLNVILCVGEPHSVRAKGLAIARNFVRSQIEKNLLGVKLGKGKVGVLVAYEPVWAVSTSYDGKPDTPKDAAEMIGFLKERLKTVFRAAQIPVLYGGSTNGKNGGKFLGEKTIDGLLVGAASLNAKEFGIIIESADKRNS